MKHQLLFYFLLIFLFSACKAVIDIEPVIIPDPTTDTSFTTSRLPTRESEKNSTQMSPPTASHLSSGMKSMIEKAKDDLAQRLSIAVTQIDLVEAKNVVWPDASLGCPQPGMMYAQVQTLGFSVWLEAQGQMFEYHTDTGRFVVLCEEESASNVVPSNVPTILSEDIVTTPVNGDLERLIDIAKEDLARRLEITPDEIEVVHIEKAEWPDTSLGCAEPSLARRPVTIPGYRIILITNGWEYVYHTGKESGVVYCPKG
jgi:hypothetical protein